MRNKINIDGRVEFLQQSSDWVIYVAWLMGEKV